SRVAQVEMPFTAGAGLVMISPANTNPGLTLRLYAPNFGADFDALHPAGRQATYFRMIATDVMQATGELAKFAGRLPPTDLGARKAVVVDGHTFNEAMVGGFSEQFLARDGVNVGSESIAVGGIARLAELAAMIAATRPDVVVYGGTTAEGGDLLKARLVKAGYLGLFVGGDGIVGDPACVTQAGVATANEVFAISSVPDPVQSMSRAAARFVRDFHARYPGETLDGYGAYAYDAAMVLITAIRELIQTH